MFDQLFKRPGIIARHRNAPFANERARYLAYCKQRGDTHGTLLMKAHDLIWAARRFQKYGTLDISKEQFLEAAQDWSDREAAYGQKLKRWSLTTERFIFVVGRWLRYLGYLRKPKRPIPFLVRMEEYCTWAKEERGLSENTIKQARWYLTPFLRWYGNCGRPIEKIRVADIDAYLAYGHDELGWCRVSVGNVAGVLRSFFLYGARRGWCHARLAEAVRGPRRYSLEGLPIGPTWEDVQRLFAAIDIRRPKDVRDKAILMLLAIYGLRAGEVAGLSLDNLDWEHDLLNVSREKRRGAMTYPLLPSVGDAILDYLKKVRPASSHRNVFLGVSSPRGPMTSQNVYAAVAPRLKALHLKLPHFGPHSLRHACATRLLAEGLSLKEIGDHLGHRCPDITEMYAKVDLAGLRKVAAFDLGDLP